MATIDEILKESGFAEWRPAEQRALAMTMRNMSQRKSIEGVTDSTVRVQTTLIKILDTHLPTTEKHDIEEV